MTTAPFKLIEKAVRQLIEARYAPAVDKTGGDPDFDPATVDLFVEVSLVFGSTTLIDGEWSVDVDCYGRNYAAAMNHALGIEAAILGGRYVTSEMRLDNVYQNEAPSERPWDDEGVFKVGATYVFTARRPSSA